MTFTIVDIVESVIFGVFIGMFIEHLLAKPYIKVLLQCNERLIKLNSDIRAIYERR